MPEKRCNPCGHRCLRYYTSAQEEFTDCSAGHDLRGDYEYGAGQMRPQTCINSNSQVLEEYEESGANIYY